jgi:hypothetical protein
MKLKIKIKIKYKAFIYRPSEELNPLILKNDINRPTPVIPIFNIFKPAYICS